MNGTQGIYIQGQEANPSHNSNVNSMNIANFRRQSVAHSQGMGGVSWGSLTIGSWLKDEVMMHASNYLQQQHHQQQQQQQFQQMQQQEQFPQHNWNNGMDFQFSPPSQSSYLPNLEANYCKDYSCCGLLLPSLHDLLRHYEEAHISDAHSQGMGAHDQHMVDPMQHGYGYQQQQQQQPARRPFPAQNGHNLIDSVSTNEVFLQHQPQFFGNYSMKQAQAQPPKTSMFQGRVEPSFKPERVPTPQPQQGDYMDEDSSEEEEEEEESKEMYIDDPARHLYVMDHEEHKPFKCPVIGCDKTYKNQNGLKYHKLHGHQNQKLHENPDGTFSIIDPESNAPYPDGMGFEKDKPYRCEVCGKRYKNLNGLKYHRGHSTH